MTTKIAVLQDKPPRTQVYAWSTFWVQEYESPWGIFEKFKFANSIDTKELLRTFGTEELLAIKHLSLTGINSNLVSMERLDVEKINSILKLPVKENNNQIRELISQRTPTKNVFRTTLTYCKRCIHEGFHSLLHQLSFLRHCPFHPHAKLYDFCIQCKREFPYRLNDLVQGFTCQCGHVMISHVDTFHLRWRTYKPQIKSPLLLRFLALTEEEIDRLKRICFFHSSAPESFDHFLEIYLSHIDPSIPIDPQIVHRQMTSHSHIFRHGNRKEDYERARYIGNGWRMRELDKQIENEIYSGSLNTFNAIRKRLRETVMRRHEGCVGEVLEGVPTCPYAYAYLNWWVSVLGFRNHKAISEPNNINRKKDYLRMETISVEDHSFFERFRMVWEGGLEFHPDNIRYRSSVATKWVYNHLLYVLLMNHFNNWLEFAFKKKYLHNDKFYLYFRRPFGYEGLPMFSIITNENSIDFHIWESNSPKRHLSDQIVCHGQ